MRRVITSTLVCLSLLTGHGCQPAWSAVTQGDVDAAKAAADVAEAQKRESDARIDMANASSTASATLAKAQIDAEKARSDYYLSLVPDPSKYKVAAPGAPKVDGSVARRAHAEAASAAESIANSVRTALAPLEPASCPSKKIYVLPSASATSMRALVTTSLSTQQALVQLSRTIAAARNSLTSAQAPVPEGLVAGTPAVRAAALPVVAAVVQGVLSFATIAKPQYATTSSSVVTTSDAILNSAVIGRLAKSECIVVIDANSVASITPIDFIEGYSVAPTMARLNEVQKQIAEARQAVIAAAAQQLGDPPEPKADPTAKEKATAEGKAKLATDRSDRISKAAKTLSDYLDAADKSLAALYVADAQGTSPLDASIRGDLLRQTLGAQTEATYMLATKSISSDADIAAKDGLFTRASTAIASTTNVSWQLIRLGTGQIVAADTLSVSLPPEIHALWPF
jgi:hypothetical protein